MSDEKKIMKTLNGYTVYDEDAHRRIDSLEGSAPGLVFDTVADMEAYVAEHSAELKVGQNLYIRAVDVPDYWWDGTAVQELETKVDLSGYATQEEVDQLSEAIANLQISGLTTAQVNALDGMFKVAAYTKADVSAEYNAFKTAFGITDSGEVEPDEPDKPVEPDTPEVTVTSLSATYSGGDVPVGTALTDLTGIVVTAAYSDGSTETVTGYTLNGEIAEGQNEITVAYGGLTTTIYVVGVSGGVSNETQWTNGVPYEFVPVENEYIDSSNGSFITYNNWDRTPYLNCKGASSLRFTLLLASSIFGDGGNGGYNAFYDANKNFISSFAVGIKNTSVEGDYVDVSIPENAEYFAASHKDRVYNKHVSITPIGEEA